MIVNNETNSDSKMKIVIPIYEMESKTCLKPPTGDSDSDNSDNSDNN